VVQKVLHGGAVGGQSVGHGGWRRGKCTTMVQKLHNGGAESAAWRAVDTRPSKVVDRSWSKFRDKRGKYGNSMYAIRRNSGDGGMY